MENKTAIEWTPKNGERIWIKVFDNWSEGTYIGYDTIKEKYLAREDENIGGLLLASSKVLPYNSNPNKNKQQTAMMELVDYMKANFHLTDESLEKFEQLLEKEKYQIIDAFLNGKHQDSGIYGSIEYYNQTYLNKQTNDK